MSAYVPDYKHDIFVSYAQADNEPLLEGKNTGWVTTLIEGLKILLAQKLGRTNAYSLWMDDELRDNSPVTPIVIEQLYDSAIFLLILSPDYLSSQWCLSELDSFLSRAGIDLGRVFVVERCAVQERPQKIDGLSDYRFWAVNKTGNPQTLGIPKPNPNEFEYYQKLNNLAHQLVHQLKALKKHDQFSPVATVFLAEVTDDLKEQRNMVKYYLEEQGVRLLPNKTYSFLNLQESLDQDLAQSRLFVQLLSDKVGYGVPQFQYERAKAAGLAILQWREPELDLQSVRDSAHYDLLQASTAMELTKFQSYIIERLQPKSEEQSKTVVTGTWVFINHGPEDLEFSLQIQDFLDQKGIGYSLPLEISATTKAIDIRKDLEQNLLNCDAVIVPYYNTHVAKVRQYLMFCLRMQTKRKQPFKIIAVCDKPLPNKPPLHMKLPQMEILACPTLQIETCLPRFIEAIKT